LILSAVDLTLRMILPMRPARVPITGKGVRTTADLLRVSAFEINPLIARDSCRGFASVALATLAAR
jgi:hypothetical protein